MKASDLFVRCLEEEGVRHIFGVPGEENSDLMISLLDSSIEFLIARHEQGAAFMADVYGRLTGRPGVCLATLGPGATNLATGVANANLDHSPVVAITGQAGTTRLHKESHQNMDVRALFQPITKWSAAVYAPDNIPEVLHKAFKLAASEKPGATHVELPEDIAKEETDSRPIRRALQSRRPGADRNAVAAALELIERSEKPVILAGHGCVRMHAAEQLGSFTANTGIYAAATFMGKGALSALNDRCLYAAGLGSRDHVSEAFERADLVICVGYDMVEWHPVRWNVGKDKRIIHIDSEPAEVDEYYQTDVEIVGDVAGALRALNEELGPQHRKRTPEFAALRDRVTAEMHEHDNDTAYPMKPQRILSDVRKVLKKDDVLISDVGAHKLWVARHYPAHLPNTCVISNGFCSMGIAVPGAIVAKLVHPRRNVIGLCGDGGFMMNVQELATAAQYKIPATILVWEDGMYSMIKIKQEAQYGRSAHTEFTNPDIPALAEAFGCRGIAVETAEGLIPALEKALAETSRPSVVSVRVDPAENSKLVRRVGDVISH